MLQPCGWRHSVKATPSQNETIFWRVVSGAYGKAASALHRVKSGICQGITWGLMSNKYCQALVELRNKPAHELKDVGDQWRTPDNIFWGINTLFGPFVLDLFTDGDNAKCAAYYTAEDNALAHDWSERLAELKGAAFGNPHTAAPVSMRGNTSPACVTS